MVGIYKTRGIYWRGGLYQREGSNTNFWECISSAFTEINMITQQLPSQNISWQLKIFVLNLITKLKVFGQK